MAAVNACWEQRHVTDLGPAEAGLDGGEHGGVSGGEVTVGGDRLQPRVERTRSPGCPLRVNAGGPPSRATARERGHPAAYQSSRTRQQFTAI